MKTDMNFKVEGNGNAIVFIHGFSDNLNYWEILTSHLKKDYKIIRFDLRGHGGSEIGSKKLTVSLLSDDLKNLLDNLNIKKVSIVGFSLGGAIAMDFTIRNPDRVSSLVLMSSFYKCDDNLKKVFNKFRNALSEGFGKFYDLILPMVLCSNVIEKHEKELEFIKKEAIKTADSNALIKVVDACLSFDIEDKLSEITQKTLILAGEFDEITSPSFQKDLSNKIKNSRLVILKNTKHNLLVGKNNAKILNILKKEIKMR